MFTDPRDLDTLVECVWSLVLFVVAVLVVAAGVALGAAFAPVVRSAELEEVRASLVACRMRLAADDLVSDTPVCPDTGGAP